MDGIVLINKPQGMTSHDVIIEARKIFKIPSVGHIGTLDPMATGVLPLLLKSATKTSKYLITHDKEYIATIKLGIKTDTGDITGQVIEEKSPAEYLLNNENIENVLKTFLGKQKQIPPMYSAVKVDGKKLYEYAREGKTVEREARDIEIYDIELINFDNSQITFKVHCSSGTYIRTICEEIAEKFLTVGTMAVLERTKVADYEIENAVDLETLKTMSLEEIEKKHIISLEHIFKNSLEIKLEDEKELEFFKNGRMMIKKVPNGMYRVYNHKGIFLGLSFIKSGILKREIIVNKNI